MDDMISRQAAIDAICGVCQADCIPCEFDTPSRCGMVKAVQALPSAQSEQRWIHVTERPPEEDEQVFVYLFDDSPYIAWICGGRWHTEEFTLDKDEEPVAWMSLPAPYEGGRKE